ncbi:MAG: single-stranded-DNA-specific exonuclease RecJ [Candidatus Thermoplasmatota archaeon]|nr:single-stranded-DNA-specific exonuclease RecJ [Candidatus Thermoplasmatota archaeon]
MTTLRRMKWVLRDEDPVEAASLSREIRINPLLARILASRGMIDTGSAADYLDPDIGRLHSPSLMADIGRGASRVKEAVEDGSKILVHGDYDTDGLTATALMVRFLKSAGGSVAHFIPSRFGDGYGLSEGGMDHALKEGASLILTVDCGIRAMGSVNTAAERGVDVVVTDHHEPGPELPRAYAVIDPKRPDCGYPFKDLAGVGVAFKLASMLQDIGLEADALSYLDLVSIGTIADIVPLVGENRVMVDRGLKLLEDTDMIGLRSLMRECGIDPFMGVRSDDVSYRMVPRLNAVGRLGDPRMALELLLTNDRFDAELFSKEMNALNFKRRSIGEKVYSEAMAQAMDGGYTEDMCLVLSDPEWHPGVVGLAASKLCEEIGLPVIVISVEGVSARGSCRSPSGVDMISALEYCSDLLEEFGGHENAAGLTIVPDNIPALRERMNHYFEVHEQVMGLLPVVEVDIDASFEELSVESVSSLERMDPVGKGNRENLVRLREIRLVDVRTVGQGGEHLRFMGEREGKGIACIWFRMGGMSDMVRNSSVVDMIGSLSVHRWGGREEVQMKVLDMDVLSGLNV